MLSRTVGSCLTLVLAAVAVHAQHFDVDVSVFRGDPNGSREAGTLERVACPQLAIKSGESGSLLVGGKAFVGKQMVTVGEQVEVTAKDLGDGAIRLMVVFEQSHRLSSKKAQTAATVQSGGTVRVEIGDDPKNKHWVDVTVRKAK